MVYAIKVTLINFTNGNDDQDGVDKLEIAGALPFVPPEGLTISAESKDGETYGEFIVGIVDWVITNRAEGYFEIKGSQSDLQISTEELKVTFRDRGWKVKVVDDEDDE